MVPDQFHLVSLGLEVLAVENSALSVSVPQPCHPGQGGKDQGGEGPGETPEECPGQPLSHLLTQTTISKCLLIFTLASAGCKAFAPCHLPILFPPQYQDPECSNSFSCPIPSAHSNLLPQFLVQGSASSHSSCLLAFFGVRTPGFCACCCLLGTCLGLMLSWPDLGMRLCLYMVHTAVRACVYVRDPEFLQLLM